MIQLEMDVLKRVEKERKSWSTVDENREELIGREQREEEIVS